MLFEYIQSDYLCSSRAAEFQNTKLFPLIKFYDSTSKLWKHYYKGEMSYIDFLFISKCLWPPFNVLAAVNI